MRQPLEWTAEDLKRLIETKTPESIELEYKRREALSPDKKDEISKDVSAFANSAGGTIVYGMQEVRGIPTGLIGLERSDRDWCAWLDQVITSGIQRRIDGVRINCVGLEGVGSGTAIVVCIPQSFRAPHQASDKKFYKRYNGRSEPMEEYEVRDVSRRAEGPLLTVGLEIEEARALVPDAPDIRKFSIAAWARNDGVTPVEYFLLTLYLDPRLRVKANPRWRHGSDLTLLAHDQSRTLPAFSSNHGGPTCIPVFGGAKCRIATALGIENPVEPGTFEAVCFVRAPYSPPCLARAQLVWTGEIFTINEEQFNRIRA